MAANVSHSNTKYQTTVGYGYSGIGKNFINRIKHSNSSPASIFCNNGAWAAVFAFTALEKFGSSLGKFALRKIVLVLPDSKKGLKDLMRTEKMGEIVGLLSVASIMGVFFRKLFDSAYHSKGVLVPDYMSFTCIPSSDGQDKENEISNIFKAGFEHFTAVHKQALDDLPNVKYTVDEAKRLRAARLGVSVGPTLAVLAYLSYNGLAGLFAKKPV